MKILTCSALIGVALTLAACSSDNDSGSNEPVTGDFHAIQPADVDAYVANYQSERQRVTFQLNGVTQPLSYVGELMDEGLMVAGFNNNDLLFIGFDFDNDEPLPTLSVVEVGEDDETVERTWNPSGDIAVQQSGDDFQYSGRLRDTASDQEAEVSLVLNESLILGGSSTITVSGTDAIVSGGLGTGTYVQMRDMIAANPNVNRLILQESDGSSNDAINMHTGRLIRAANLATHVPADGDINSGAVDLFTAGVTRTVEAGGMLGVHSWCCENGLTADRLSRSSQAHGPQLTYFREMLPQTGVDFYFFTLQAASFDDIHQMTREEMVEFGVVTE